MKKFSDVLNKKYSIDYKEIKNKNKNNEETDVTVLNDYINKELQNDKSDDKWEILKIIDISLDEPKKYESIVINAELSNKTVKRGDIIYITALLHKKGSYYHQSQLGVIKVRVVDIYKTVHVLNSLLKK